MMFARVSVAVIGSLRNVFRKLEPAVSSKNRRIEGLTPIWFSPMVRVFGEGYSVKQGL